MNRSIYTSTAIILGVGVLSAIARKKPISTVILGGLSVAVLLAILEALNPQGIGPVVAALSTLAAITALIAELPEVLKSFGLIK